MGEWSCRPGLWRKPRDGRGTRPCRTSEARLEAGPTIIYTWWDGEEPSLLGSTEWAETHADELREHAVAYINSDGNDRGYLNAGGSHTLERFVNGVARDIEDPGK